MDILTKSDIKRLVDERDETCLSIYMPTFRKGAETQQNAIRFKNLLRDAADKLDKLGLKPEAKDSLLEPAKELLSDNDFWQHQSNGLAFFRSTNTLHSFRLPLELEELVVVGNRLHIKPLLSLIRGDGQFYVLALNLSQVRLFRCSKYRIKELELSNAPTSLAQALKYDTPERQLQLHTAKGQGRAAIFHGQGKGVDIDDAEHKKNILRFFQQLDNGVTTLLTNSNAPLVLAGVDYLIPLYREANSYFCLMEQSVAHHPNELSDHELHRKAWGIVRPYFQQDEKRAAEKYRELAGSGKTSDNVGEVVRESHNKRVESLFVKKGLQVWGLFDEDRGEVVIHEKAEPADADLLDLAAVQTLVNGGSVYMVSPDHMPGKGDLDAVFRY